MTWSVNYASANPISRSTFLVAGDDPASVLIDARSGLHIAQLHGHMDYSFAAGWSPDGSYLATGMQYGSLPVFRGSRDWWICISI